MVDVVVILGDQIFKKLVVQIHAIKFPVLSKIWSPHVRESKTVLDSGFHAVDYGFQILNSLSLELGFQIPIFRWIPDFLSCRPGSQPRIPDSTSECSSYSGFHKQKFIRFQFTRLLRDYYASALRSCYNVEDPRTGKRICLKCNYARTLISRLPCCF